jgi:hypothetical protein
MPSGKNRRLYRPCAYSLYVIKEIALMKLLEEVKSHSSKWMKTKGDDLAGFTGRMAMVRFL